MAAVVHGYIAERFPNADGDIRRLAASDEPLLPLIPDECFYLAWMGHLPRWDGFERQWSEREQRPAESAESEPPPPKSKPAPRGKSRRPEPTDTAGLF